MNSKILFHRETIALIWTSVINWFRYGEKWLDLKKHFKNVLKDTLMQILKCPYMFVFLQKQYSANFAFLKLRILELFAREVCKFLKK